jgi:hypothetical protein
MYRCRDRIYGIIIANTLLKMPSIDIFKKIDLITELKQAKESLENVLCDDDSDIDALYAMCIVINTICVLKGLGYISPDHNIERISIENDKYYKMLEDLSNQSDEANKNLDSCKDYISSLSIAGLQSKGYKVTEVPEDKVKDVEALFKQADKGSHGSHKI